MKKFNDSKDNIPKLVKIINECVKNSDGDKLEELMCKIDSSLFLPLYQIYSKVKLTPESSFVVFNSMIFGIGSNPNISCEKTLDLTVNFLHDKNPLIRSLAIPNLVILLEECYCLDGSCSDPVLAKNVLKVLEDFLSKETEVWLKESTQLIYDQYKS